MVVHRLDVVVHPVVARRGVGAARLEVAAAHLEVGVERLGVAVDVAALLLVGVGVGVGNEAAAVVAAVCSGLPRRTAQ